MRKPFSLFSAVYWLIPVMMPVLFLTSCSGDKNESIVLDTNTYQVESDTHVTIQMDSGQIVITNGKTGQVVVTGEASQANLDRIDITQESDRLTIQADNKGRTIKINLQVPAGTPVQISTFDTQVVANNYTGDLDVTSTAGDILISHMDGLAVLRANRGDVLLESSQGEFHLPGNYGLLSLEDVSGIIEASTIMGTIRYRGRVDATDQVRLETDHGPVEAWLDPDSDVTVLIQTTTGVVDCVIPGFSTKGAGCTGQLGTGEGSFFVRTVSGEVDLKPTP